MRTRPFFTDYSVRKGDRVYVLDRRETTYEIEECEAASVGSRYVTARYDSGLKERFERLSEIRPGYGLWLECMHFDGYPNIFKKRLFPTRDLAERNKAILEKVDAEKAQART